MKLIFCRPAFVSGVALAWIETATEGGRARHEYRFVPADYGKAVALADESHAALLLARYPLLFKTEAAFEAAVAGGADKWARAFGERRAKASARAAE